jgi:hypothetical protein
MGYLMVLVKPVIVFCSIDTIAVFTQAVDANALRIGGVNPG